MTTTPNTLRFTVYGDPRTKKTSQRIVRFGPRKEYVRVLPSLEHEQWFQDAMWQAPEIRRELEARGVKLPIAGPVQVTALFYRRVLVGDLAGHIQALGDWLQAPRLSPGKTRQLRDGAGIIEDDVLIVSWDGSRVRKDAGNPRIEVTVQLMQEQLGLGEGEPELQEVST